MANTIYETTESEFKGAISPIEALIADARNGKPVILIDDEDRENEGDLVIPAQLATPDIINFMAKEGRGLICLAMEKPMIDRLDLDLMGRGDNTHHRTAFTVSIEAKEGVTTGISAADRAHTIQTAINPGTNAHDIATPGHVFPLIARAGGVLERTGHTEASVDIARLAGFSGAGVICEIMKDDGEMARLPDLITFAENHDLKVGTIADLVAYRMREEKLVVKMMQEKSFKTISGVSFDLHVYKDGLTGLEHLALTTGKINPEKPVHVRMHSFNIFKDIFDTEHSIDRALSILAEKEQGVFVLMRGDMAEPSQLLSKAPKQPQDNEQTLRRFGMGAQILKDLGVANMVLLTNTKKTIIGLHGFGLNIIEQQEIHGNETI